MIFSDLFDREENSKVLWYRVTYTIFFLSETAQNRLFYMELYNYFVKCRTALNWLLKYYATWWKWSSNEPKKIQYFGFILGRVPPGNGITVLYIYMFKSCSVCFWLSKTTLSNASYLLARLLKVFTNQKTMKYRDVCPFAHYCSSNFSQISPESPAFPFHP